MPINSDTESSALASLGQQGVELSEKPNSIDKMFETFKNLKESQAKVQSLQNEHLDKINNYNMESLQKAVTGQGGGEQIDPATGKISPPDPDTKGRIDTLRQANMAYDTAKSLNAMKEYYNWRQSLSDAEAKKAPQVDANGQQVQTPAALPPPEMVASFGPRGGSFKQVDPTAQQRADAITSMADTRKQQLATNQLKSGVIAAGTNLSDPVNIGGKQMKLANDAVEFQKDLGDTNSMMNKVSASANTIMLHAGTGIDILNQAKLAKQPPVVAIQNLAAKISGQPQVTDTNLARHIITTEFGRLLNGIAAREGERQEVADALGKDPGDAQVRDAYKLIAKMGRERLKPFEQQYKDTLGADPGDRLFQPASKVAYGKVLGAAKYNKTKDVYLDSSGKEIS